MAIWCFQNPTPIARSDHGGSTPRTRGKLPHGFQAPGPERIADSSRQKDGVTSSITRSFANSSNSVNENHTGRGERTANLRLGAGAQGPAPRRLRNSQGGLLSLDPLPFIHFSHFHRCPFHLLATTAQLKRNGARRRVCRSTKRK